MTGLKHHRAADEDRAGSPGIARKGRTPLARLAALALCALVAGWMVAGRASAHDVRPLSIDIAEQGASLYRAHVRVPPTVALDNQPAVIWPGNCRVLHERLQDEDDAATPNEAMFVSCTGGLEGAHIGVRYPIYNPSLSTLLRLSQLGGKVLTQVLTPDQSDWQVPREPGWREAAFGYFALGVRHIWTGIDHLLFVAGLLILAGTAKRVLLAITGFTLAHSITLSLSALGLVQLPAPPVEAAIALSILFLAREIARPFPGGLAERFPIAVSSSFGLLHGFGFAAALREVGLPTKELAIGLACFNLGVEVGQIVFIAGVVILALAVRKAVQLGGLATIWLQCRSARLQGYALGIPAALWFIQRLAAF